MKKRYKIAEITIEIISVEENGVWTKLESNYQPFLIDDVEAIPKVRIKLIDGLVDIPSNIPLLLEDLSKSPDIPNLYVFRDSEDDLYFKIIQPYDVKERTILKLSHNFEEAVIHIENKGEGQRPWQVGASLTAMIQMSYFLAAQQNGILFTHASCVVKEGKAYLFLGKSGTGKSTHSRMWKEAFNDAILLNDDHPIIRIEEADGVKAYGSPWSGKTPCYKNISAPVGGIVRICRDKTNFIKLLGPVEAYASLMTSMFNAPFDRRLTDLRHKWIERVVAIVPCYELHCLPDVDAARVCWTGLSNK